jgi:hypothetical protein
VIKSGSGSGLALETVQGIRIASEFVTQELERDRALEPRVFGLLDHAHPTAEVSQNAVMGDGLPDHESPRQFGRWTVWEFYLTAPVVCVRQALSNSPAVTEARAEQIAVANSPTIH